MEQPKIEKLVKLIFSKIFGYPGLDLFESIMSYYTDDVRAFQRVPGKSIQQRMKNFLDDPKKYYGFDASHYERFAKNAMMWDFGYVKNKIIMRQPKYKKRIFLLIWIYSFDNDEEDDEAIDQWIQYLDDTFDLGKCHKNMN